MTPFPLFMPISLDSPLGSLSPENAESSAIESSLDHAALMYYEGTFQFSTLISIQYSQKSASKV